MNEEHEKIFALCTENIELAKQVNILQNQLNEKQILLNILAKTKNKRSQNIESKKKSQFYKENKDSKEVLEILQNRYNKHESYPWQLVKQVTNELYDLR